MEKGNIFSGGLFRSKVFLAFFLHSWAFLEDMTQLRRAATFPSGRAAAIWQVGDLDVVCGSVRAVCAAVCAHTNAVTAHPRRRWHRCSGKWVRGGGGGGMRRREMAEQQEEEEEEEEEMFAERKKRRKRFQRSWKRKSHPIHESGLI